MSFFNCNLAGSAGGSGGATGGLVTKFEKSVTISSSELAEVTINLSEDISNYANITNEQIIVELKDIAVNTAADSVGRATLEHTYNSETGDLTITSTSSRMPFSYNSTTELELFIYVLDVARVTSTEQLKGSFPGDNSESKKIHCGFRPSTITVHCITNNGLSERIVIYNDAINTDKVCGGSSSSPLSDISTNTWLTLNEDGFTINNAKLLQSVCTVYWVATK